MAQQGGMRDRRDGVDEQSHDAARLRQSGPGPKTGQDKQAEEGINRQREPRNQPYSAPYPEFCLAAEGGRDQAVQADAFSCMAQRGGEYQATAERGDNLVE